MLASTGSELADFSSAGASQLRMSDSVISSFFGPASAPSLFAVQSEQTCSESSLKAPHARHFQVAPAFEAVSFLLTPPSPPVFASTSSPSFLFFRLLTLLPPSL